MTLCVQRRCAGGMRGYGVAAGGVRGDTPRGASVVVYPQPPHSTAKTATLTATVTVSVTLGPRHEH